MDGAALVRMRDFALWYPSCMISCPIDPNLKWFDTEKVCAMRQTGIVRLNERISAAVKTLKECSVHTQARIS